MFKGIQNLFREVFYRGFAPGSAFGWSSCLGLSNFCPAFTVYQEGKEVAIPWDYGIVVGRGGSDGKVIFLFGGDEDYARLVAKEYLYTYRQCNWFEDRRFRYYRATWFNCFKPDPKIIKFLESCFPIVTAKYELEIEIRNLNLMQMQVSQLIPKLSKSILYGHKVELLQRLTKEIEKSLDQCRQLNKEYDKLINEATIGLQILEFDPGLLDTLPSSLELDLKLSQIRESISLLQSDAEAYAVLATS